TNFNHRSFLHDLELDISLHQPQSKRQLCAFFEEDLSQSIEVSLEHSNNKFSERWLGLLARVLRYWM
ncbi:MAG: cardiolipin synthase B, partial [Pseudomonadota bacterium]|nr:cardiolipin synthase B [Pseudomonadota bacterium]